MVVVAEKDEGADLHVVEAGGARQDTEDDRVELAGRAKEEPALEGAAGHFDQGAFGRQKTHGAAHA